MKSFTYLLLVLIAFTLPAQDYHLEMVGNIDLPGVVRDVIVSGDVAYVTNDIGVVAIDVSEPSFPQVLSSVETPGKAIELFLKEPYLYVADSDSGVAVIDVSFDESIEYITSAHTYNTAVDLFKQDQYLFVACRDSGLVVFNVMDIENISTKYYGGGFMWWGYKTRSIAFIFEPYPNDYHFYMAHTLLQTGWGVISHFDFSPLNNSVMGMHQIFVDTYPRLSDLEKMEGSRFILSSDSYGIINANYDSWYIIIDDSPLIKTKGVYCNQEAFGNKVFVAAGLDGVRIYDMDVPAVVSNNSNGYAIDLFVQDDYLYIADSSALAIQKIAPNNISGDLCITSKPKYNIQAFPNPFNGEACISYHIEEAGNVVLSVYNIKGQLIKTLESGYKEKGNHSVTWDTDDSGNDAASGIYFIGLKTKYGETTKKILYLK